LWLLKHIGIYICGPCIIFGNRKATGRFKASWGIMDDLRTSLAPTSTHLTPTSTHNGCPSRTKLLGEADAEKTVAVA
jgi:hypothetical protein